MWAAGQFCGSGAFVDEIVAVRTTHEAFHIGERISVGPVFDAWAGRARDALPQSRQCRLCCYKENDNGITADSPGRGTPAARVTASADEPER